MTEDIDSGAEQGAPVWAVFGDLMSVLLGAFVLVLVGVVAMQAELSAELQSEVERQAQLTAQLEKVEAERQAEAQRRQELEQALAAPLAAGRVTLTDGRIGISGSVLFALNSDQLQPEGHELVASLAAPLSDYLQSRDEMLMVSGFTDDRPVHDGNRRFADNWELSAQRALTVTRALIDAGVPSSSVFVSAFGQEQPVASNEDDEGRSKNRRVEISPVPRRAVEVSSDGGKGDHDAE